MSKPATCASKEYSLLFKASQPSSCNQTATQHIVTQTEKKCHLICTVYHPNSSLKLLYFRVTVEVNPPNKPDMIFLKRSAWYAPHRDHNHVCSKLQTVTLIFFQYCHICTWYKIHPRMVVNLWADRFSYLHWKKPWNVSWIQVLFVHLVWIFSWLPVPQP